MSVDKILKTLKEKAYKFVDLRFCDTRGKEQHVSLPVKAVHEDLFEDGKMFEAPAGELRRQLLEDLPRTLGRSERSEVEGLLGEVDDRRLVRACRELGAPPSSPPQPWSVLDDDVFAEPQKLFARLAQP